MDADPLTRQTVDDLLVDNAGFDTDDDPFADKPPRNAERDDKTTLSPRKRKANEDIFGKVDEEVKITKQRKKIPKLDAEKLLSEPGIPKMRKMVRSGEFKKKLRLKGKGHEFTDAAKLLNYYQMWLDNLYPRAKFADAVQLVEKAGHTKRMHMYRKSWIDESKPGHVRKEDVDAAVERQDAERNTGGLNLSLPERSDNHVSDDEDPAALFFGAHEEDDAGPSGGPDDDELDALIAQGDEPSLPSTKDKRIEVDSEGEDDLDALLAQEQPRKQSPPRPVVAEHHQEEEDELEAMLNHEYPAVKSDSKEQSNDTAPSPQVDARKDEPDSSPDNDSQADASAAIVDAVSDNAVEEELDDDDDDMGHFDALLNKQHDAPEPELPTIEATQFETTAQSTTNPLPNSEEVPELDNVVSSSPIPNIQTDELDELMDEHDATLSKRHADVELVEEFMSSSPIPNRDSQ